jgi:hypothetical protein
MFRLKANILTAILLIFSAGLHGQNESCCAKNRSFRDDEKLTFRVFYNVGFVWINAGNVHFNTKSEEMNHHKVYHVAGIGKTAKSYVFFKVNDKYETYIDKETMAPVRFVRNVNEGGFKINQDVAFNQKKGEAISDKKEYIIPKCTQDALSSIYFARNINYNNYKPGDKIPFNMFLDDKVYNLYIKYIGKEVIETRIGTFNSIKISPLLIEGTIFKDGEKMTVWITDDDNHLPLRVESPIIVGSIKVDLIDADNLKNPFTSIINQ